MNHMCIYTKARFIACLVPEVLEIGNLNDLLSKVLAPEHSCKGLGRVLDALGLIHAINNLLVHQQILDVSEEIFKVLLMEVGHDEAADGQSLADNLHEVLDAIGLACIVLRDHATGNDPSMVVHIVDGSFQRLTTDVLKVNVDALGSKLLEGIMGRALLVVEGSIKADILEQVIDLVVRSSYPRGDTTKGMG